MHNFLTGRGPPDCIDLFTYISEIHQVPTRNAVGELLYIPKVKLKSCERDFAIEGPKLWNQVPYETRKIQSHEKFKQEIRKIEFK